MNTAVKVIIAVLVAIFGICGLLMTLCGGAFTVMATSSQDTGIYLLSIGSMVAGLLSMWGAYKYFVSTKQLEPEVISAKAAEPASVKPTDAGK